MVQALAGHATPPTTVRYGRRPETAKATASQRVRVPNLLAIPSMDNHVCQDARIYIWGFVNDALCCRWPSYPG